MKTYAVGDTVLVPCKVVAVHPQGFPSGLDEFGRAKNPTETETPATVIALTPDNVEVDSAGHVHFSAAAEI